MKIKKNGVTINLTESDIKRLSKRILKEQPLPHPKWEDRWQQERGRVDPSDYEKLKVELVRSLDASGEVVIRIKDVHAKGMADVQFYPSHLSSSGSGNMPMSSLTVPINDLPEILPNSN